MFSFSPDNYINAWNLASIAHKGQTYGGPSEDVRIDYLNHIGSVAFEVLWAIQNSEIKNQHLAIHCAILHDVLEDSDISYATIEESFGQEIAKGVLALTKNTAFPTKLEQMKDSLYRIKEQPSEVWIVKMADRITNLYHPPFYWNNDKITAYIEEAKLIHQELKEANELIASRLWEKIEEYKKFLK